MITDISQTSPELLQAFSEQTKEMLVGVETFLHKGRNINEEELYEVYRLVHRCKGDAEFLMLSDIATIAEQMLFPIRNAHNQRRPLTDQEQGDVAKGLDQFHKLDV